jgi:hypothetical protein
LLFRVGLFDGDLLEGEGLIGFVGIAMGDRFREGASGPESAMVWSCKPKGERRRKGRLGGGYTEGEAIDWMGGREESSLGEDSA